LVEKEKEKEKEEKAKVEGKKKVDNGGQVLASSMGDQGSKMQAKSQSGLKKKATVLQLIEDVITHVPQALIVTEDDLAKSENVFLNISIKNLVEDMNFYDPTWYKGILAFLKKVLIFGSN